MIRAGAVFLLLVMLAGCATRAPQGCPAGQERLRTAQLFFGRNDPAQPRLNDRDFRRFVNEELTTRFPDGLTVLDGGGQWKGEENRRIREAAKVVLIVLPKDGDAQARLDAVKAAYKVRFNQDSDLLVTPPACVSF
ncbi:DUF3574 domain-containing protein [Phenylobacterium sp.]|uniref:DUF3574 domain-containing protein n=1 Tax=Phenylobacterium sp. TaxID=1871053 RepID=UPI002DF403D5|nr:DUF3574 domain-containing protein [Phenylobacterium sp.]